MYFLLKFLSVEVGGKQEVTERFGARVPALGWCGAQRPPGGREGGRGNGGALYITARR